MDINEYISVAELAKILGISRIAVFKKIKKEEIPAIKIGRNYAIRRDDIPVLSNITSQDKKASIEKAVKKTVDEYGEVLRKLGRE